MNIKINRFAAVVLLLCFSTSIFADIQTLTLNTGFDHAINQRYVRPNPLPPWTWPLPASSNYRDDYWTLIHDPSTNGGTPIPRQAHRIASYPSAWIPAIANSEWIAFEPNGVPFNDGKSARVYVFEKCFCLKKGFDADKVAYKKTVMDIQLRADDWAAVYLNETLPTILGPAIAGFVEPDAILQTTTAAGGFSNPTPAYTQLDPDQLLKRLRVGRNCLQVKIYDLGLVVSGFNLTGSITAQGIDEVAKFNPKNPKQPFSQCSSCYNIKTAGVDVPFGTTEKVKANITIRPR